MRKSQVWVLTLLNTPGAGRSPACLLREIIKGRPSQRKDELVQKKIPPRATYEGIKYKIVAKQQ